MPCNCTTDNECLRNCKKQKNVENGRNGEKTIQLKNPNIDNLKEDVLYHLALGSGTHDLQEMFGDVKFVCMGGTSHRMLTFANYVKDELKYKMPAGHTLQDITQPAFRYSMYKVGPVLSVSHGMGIPSVMILLHEIIKLLYHAKAKDPIFFRIGTSGGLGIEPGSVVVSNGAVDCQLNDSHEMSVLGEIIRRPAILDQNLVENLAKMSLPDDEFKIVIGKTMATNDFYEGQGRLDGAFCNYTEEDKMRYLKKVHSAGVVNIEMEATAFSALTHYAGIKASIVCVTFLDRFKGDQVTSPKTTLNEWQTYPQKVVCRYIKNQLGI